MLLKPTEQRNEINAKWLQEKQKSEDLTQVKKDIEALKLEAEKAQRAVIMLRLRKYNTVNFVRKKRSCKSWNF